MLFRRRGVFWGPLSPIYGFGTLLLSIVLVNKKDKTYMTFIKSALLGGFLEYIISFLQETFLGTTSWNYSNKLLNINGRTTIPYMIIWGLLGVLYLKVIYPLLSKLIESIKPNVLNTVTKVCVVLVAIDIVISWTALGRQTLRTNGIEPLTPIGKVYDVYFNDDYISRKFPNMVRR
jgi:uncharacterized membrane protein